MPPHRPRHPCNPPTPSCPTAPPHCRTNQYHYRYRPSHHHVIKTDCKSKPTRPLHPTNWQTLLFYIPACACHKCSQDITNGATPYKPKKGEYQYIQAHNALTSVARLHSYPGNPLSTPHQDNGDDHDEVTTTRLRLQGDEDEDDCDHNGGGDSDGDDCGHNEWR